MKVSSITEFRDHAVGLLKSKDPILVTRRGRLAGVFFPAPDDSMPLELKRELFTVFSDQIRKEIAQRNLNEDEIATDFASWRKQRREARRRR